MQSKYSSRFYWEKKIKKQQQLDLCADRKITNDSVFFHGVILDEYGVHYDEWLSFSAIDEVLGFLTYLFIPISFYSLNSKEGKLCIPIDGYLEELIDEIQESDKFYSVLNVEDMYKVNDLLNQIWDGELSEAKGRLGELQQFYLQAFNQSMKNFTYFQLFYSPLELGTYIVQGYEEDPLVTIEDLERQLNMSKEQWLELCSEVYTNEFIQRRFTGILNNRLKELF